MLKHLKETKIYSDLKLNNDSQGESESTKESDEKEKRFLWKNTFFAMSFLKQNLDCKGKKGTGRSRDL